MAEVDKRHGFARGISSTWAIVIGVVTLGYMVPWMIAALRGHRSSPAIFWLNLLLGWTFIGWVWALVWSFMPHRLAS